MAVHRDRSRLLTIRQLNWQRWASVLDIIRNDTYVYTLYLRHKDTTSAILCTVPTHHYHSCWWMVKQFNIPIMISNALQLIDRWFFMLGPFIYGMYIIVIYFAQKIWEVLNRSWYVTGPAKIDHVSANYSKLYFR